MVAWLVWPCSYRYDSTESIEDFALVSTIEELLELCGWERP